MTYQLKQIKVHDDIVSITVEDEETERKYRILLNDYLGHPLSDHQQLSEDDIKRLDEQHTYCYGYLKCIRKLSLRDQSEKELNDLLDDVFGLSQEGKQRIMASLKGQGLVNDENVAASQLFTDQNKLLGRKKTLYNLLDRGISRSLAQRIIDEVDEKQELTRGIQRGQRIIQHYKNKSQRQQKNQLYQQLLVAGYDNVDEIIARMDLPFDEEKEEENLKRDLTKALARYKHKYSGRQLYQHVYQHLLTKGYQSAIIQSCYRKEGEEYEDQ